MKESWDSWRRAKKSFKDSVLPEGAVLMKTSSDQDDVDNVNFRTEVVWNVKESGDRKLAGKNKSTASGEVACEVKKGRQVRPGKRPKHKTSPE